MNTVQDILNVITKMEYQKIFQTGLTQREEIFMTDIRRLEIKYIRILLLQGHGYVLTWQSSFLQNPVACPITDQEIKFSDLIIYKYSTKNVKGNAKAILSAECFERLNQDVESIKNIFCIYTPEIEKYFT